MLYFMLLNFGLVLFLTFMYLLKILHTITLQPDKKVWAVDLILSTI